MKNDTFPSKDLLAILRKSLDRALFLYVFIRGVRSSGVRASITIVHIRKFKKNVSRRYSILILFPKTLASIFELYVILTSFENKENADFDIISPPTLLCYKLATTTAVGQNQWRRQL